ncbi:hypothetical protein Taro_034635 [Colocasia esculenta]|uniref:Uncharacterized protein n=1 Tax=Colocasia esculenta TaxID=4460 RepID=A0A843W1E4_COLES|nr:hypothetical protein [Colocasia esculenta]
MPRGFWTNRRGQEQENSWRRGISLDLPRVLQVLALGEIIKSRLRHRPPERDGPIGRILGLDCDSRPVPF